MQFNGFLFPGPAVDLPTNYENIIYIPRGRLPEPQEEEKKEMKIGSISNRS